MSAHPELAVTSTDEWPVARRALTKWLLGREVPELLACDIVLAAEEAFALAGSVTAATSAGEVVLTIVGEGVIAPTALPLTKASAARFELVPERNRTTVIASFPLPRSESA